jgi:hypothetical protein
MSNPSDKPRAARRASDPSLPAGLALLALLVVPVVATSGVSTIEAREAPKSAAYAKDSTPSSNYQMRCWQHGRLLFEQTLYALPTDGSRYALKVSGSDRLGRPVYVADTINATCLIRSATNGWSPAR